MKRIILSFVILLAAQIGFAQEEVAIEQNINTPIGCLNINAGWEVRLMHRQTEGYRVAVVVPERFAGIAAETQVCNLAGDTLTILENTMLPRGTVVELEGNLGFRKIDVYEKASVSADRIITPDTTVTYYIFLSKNANFHINHLQFCGDPILSVNDKSTLRIDTITGQGEPFIELYEGIFEYEQDRLEGKITLKEYRKPDWNFYTINTPKIIKTEMVDGEPVTTERYKTWCEFVAYTASFGFRRGADAVDFNSPYKYSHNLSINMGLTTPFKFGEHWGLNMGLSMNYNEQDMVHQLKLEDGKLEVIDGQVPIQRNRLTSAYLGIPVELNWYLGKRGTESVSLDYYCGYLLGGQLLTKMAPDYKGWVGDPARSLFNPWKMELGLSFNTQHLGFIHGVRVFANLLPEYRPGVTTDKFRSVGLEIKL